MNPRTRLTLIIVLVILVIVGGGIGIFFLARQAGTAVGLTDIDGEKSIDLEGGNLSINDLHWINGTCNFDGDHNTHYDEPTGTGFGQTYTCTNTDDVDHTLNVEVYNLYAPAIYEPPQSGNHSGTCIDADDRQQGVDFPPQFGQREMVTIIANRLHSTNKQCEDIPQDKYSLQEPAVADNTIPISFAAGETKTFTIPHDGSVFDTCGYYQVDDVVEDDEGTRAMALGTAMRRFAQLGSPTCPFPLIGGGEKGNLQVRMWEEIDGDDEYSTPTAGGADSPFSGMQVTIADAQGNDVTGQCDNGNTTGGSGRISCFQIDEGQYTVTVTQGPSSTQYQGPIVDSSANPALGEQHNAHGDTTLTLTVVPGPQPQGVGNDIITFFDFGYKDKSISSENGSLTIRTYVESNTNPNTNEYDQAEGAILAFTDFTVNGPQGPLTGSECQNGLQTGGVGRAFCTDLVPGQYTIDIDPDITKYDGPFAETHNPNGDDPYTVQVSAGQTTIADFQYKHRIISAATVCNSLDADKTSGITPLTVNFDAQVSPQNTTYDYLWIPDPNDKSTWQTGSQSGNYQAQHTYTAEGDYYATFVTLQNNVATSACQQLIEVRTISPQQVTCGLTATPQQGNAPLDVAFAATVNPPTTTLSESFWDFGDGQTDTKTSNFLTNNHTYTSDGRYTASVTLRGPQGGDLATCTADISVGTIVASGFDCALAANPNQGNAPLQVDFTASSIGPILSSIITRSDWDFGDGNTDTKTGSGLLTNSNTYQSKGQYLATVTLTNNNNQQATCDAPVQVTDIGVPTSQCQIDVVDFFDNDQDGSQQIGFVGYAEAGMGGASVTITPQFNSTQGPQTKTTAWQGFNHWGEALFTGLECGEYEVSIDETSTVTLDGTGPNYVLNQMNRTTPGPVVTTTVTPVTPADSYDRVEFGYYPKSDEVDLTCEINKTVTDESPDDEGQPDDPKITVSSPGETLTYNIEWGCSGFDATAPNAQAITFTMVDTVPPLTTVVPGSITGGGVYDPAQGTITWTITGTSNIPSGSVSFQVIIDSNLSPGTYILPNYVTAVGRGTRDEDQTVTIVIVTDENPDEPDIQVIKRARDVNGGVLLPGDVIEYYVVVWNNGNLPLTNVRVTDNIQPNVNSFDVTSIPSGACDNSTSSGGANGTGFLDVNCFDLPNRGDTATIIYQVTVDQGVPQGTELSNLVTAASDEDQDTDDETVVVGEEVSTPPPPPPPGPGPTEDPEINTSGTSVTVTGAPVPPILGGRAVAPPTSEPGLTPETGISGTLWAIILSLLAAVGISGYVMIRQRLNLADE